MRTKFQSTLPARGATATSPRRSRPTSNFNPRSPHGERRSTPTTTGRSSSFQSTLPARGATSRAARASDCVRPFQSTLPARGATHGGMARRAGSLISIHAPRTGSDALGGGQMPGALDFNPRSPHGERLIRERKRVVPKEFQSTLPARGATKARAQRWNRLVISIHAPRTGSDESHRLRLCRKAPISIHAPRTGSDGAERLRHHGNQGISIHAPRTGSDLSRQDNRREDEAFQSTLPARGATEGVQDA